MLEVDLVEMGLTEVDLAGLGLVMHSFHCCNYRSIHLAFSPDSEYAEVNDYACFLD